MSALLELRDLTLHYRDGTLGCRDVSFDLFAGEVLGIVGESGSGKSTVIGCASLDLVPSSGRVIVAGEDVTGIHGARRRRLRCTSIGMVYQTPQQGLDFSLTAGGNVASTMLGAGWRSFGRVRERGFAYHEAMELPADRFDVPVERFSGGMRQRVALAKALATAPPLLLLDEPTAGLDVSVQARILDLVRRLHAERQFAMLVVSHDLAVMRMLADRLLVMYRGEVVERGLTDQILGDPQHPYTQLLVSAQLGA